MEHKQLKFICKKAGKGLLSVAVMIMFFLIVPASVHAAKKPAKVSGLCAAYSSSDTITVSWNKAKNAKKYVIYRSDNPETGFVKVKTTKSLTWKDTHKAGIYYYKVRAVRGKKKGAVSTVAMSDFTSVLDDMPLYNSKKIGLTGVKNARDVGGYKTSDGKTVKYKKILRSAKLENATDDDIDILEKDYQVKLVVDLRSESSSESEPDVIIPGASYFTIPIFENSFSTSGMKIKKTSDKYLQYAYYSKKYSKYKNHYLNMYKDIFLSKYSQGKYRKMFDRILKRNGCTFLIHCAAGKDRSGVGMAIILAALGVDRETITKDFGLSNVAYLSALSKAKAAGAKAGCNYNQTLAVECRVAVSEERFTKAWDAVEAEYGSMDNYLRKAIGLTDEEISKLRLWYTE